MTIPVFESVWDVLEDTPTEVEKHEAPFEPDDRHHEAVSAWGLTQTDAARCSE
jgi:predicted XRE-type DNA-binding protein